MTELIAMVGIPGSGKSTWALAWVNEKPNKRVRVNRDDCRFMLTGSYEPFNKMVEKQVTQICTHAIQTALKAGISVVVDNTHISPRHLRALGNTARQQKAEFKVQRMETSLEQALEWNQNRDKVVPIDVILRMHKQLEGAE